MTESRPGDPGSDADSARPPTIRHSKVTKSLDLTEGKKPQPPSGYPDQSQINPGTQPNDLTGVAPALAIRSGVPAGPSILSKGAVKLAAPLRPAPASPYALHPRPAAVRHASTD